MKSDITKKLTADEWGNLIDEKETERRINSKNVSCWSKEMESLTKKKDRVLEIGAGTGETSIFLSNMGREVTAVDFAENCVAQIEKISRGRVKAIFADATKEMPLEEKQYDVIFQARLLEHFSYEEQCNMLGLWKRYLKDDGIMISFVPNAASLAYRVGKARSEKKGTWPYGIESPLYSMQSQFVKAGFAVEKEYSIGAEHSLKFLSRFSLLRFAVKYWIEHNICDDICGQGYLLVTIGKNNGV